AQQVRTHVGTMARAHGGPQFARSAAAAAGVLVELENVVTSLTAASAPVAEDASEKQSAPQQAHQAAAVAKAQDRIIRVSATTVDALSLQMDQLVHFVAREERRARDLAGVMKDTGDALVASERMASELRQLGVEIPEAMAQAVGRLRELQKDLRRLSRETQRDSEQLRLMSSVVRDDLRDLRMVPASFVLEPLRRTVRDVAARVNKEVELELRGSDVKLDRRILDAVKDPLLHLIRNAVDHGLEAPDVRVARGKPAMGRLTVTVSQFGARILIDVEDDGAGLALDRIRATAVRRGLLDEKEAAALPDDEAARLIFRAGFSTAEKVTAISGRGVGLDVVHDTITRLQGTVDLSSKPGQGTRFRLDLPLTLAVKLGLLVQAGGEPCAVPNDAVERLVRLSGKDLGTLAGQLVVSIEGEHIPFTSLAEVIGLPRRPLAIDSGDLQAAIVVAVGGQRVALAVDAVLGQQEVVVHSLGPYLAEITHLAGATVLDSGKVVAVLNAAELIRIAKGAARTRDVKQRSRILVADDALTTRSAMKYLLEIAGLQVITASDGEEALALLKETPCQMLVCDVRMPRMDGLTLCREVKSDPKLSKIPVVLVTSLDSAEDRAAGLHAGADGYLVKREVERGGLLNLVRQLLGGE
ncbi:MAG: response regulator, partial [Myxococcaceae bacterium]